MFIRSAVSVLLATSTSFAMANALYVNFDNFNYSGTISRYNSQADAQARTNATSTTAIATSLNGTSATLTNARDAQAFISRGASTAYGINNEAAFLTAWYFINPNTTNTTNGWGNPNNTNNGFVQYIDVTTVPVVAGGWSNGYTQFNVSINGGNGDASNFARLWAAPSELGGSTAGTFVDFNLNLTADFVSAATVSSTTAWYETNAMPSAVSGTANGVFLNDSTTPSLNGYYSFDFALASGSWAANSSATWNNAGTRIAPQSFFAAPESASVPLPSSLALIGLGILAFISNRKKAV
jgi:PEP-CTERM motif